MKLNELRDLVKALNRELFKRLNFTEDEQRDLVENGQQIELASCLREDHTDGDEQPLGQGDDEDRCFCGKLKGVAVTSRDYRNLIRLTTPGCKSGHGRVAVGFVIDEATANCVDDLGVVLAVGINYGQGSFYLTNPVRLLDDTKMRKQMDESFQAIRDNDACGVDLPAAQAYHLVVFNIFPWITTESWGDLSLMLSKLGSKSGGFNNIEEALFIKCLAPTADVASLINEFVERNLGKGSGQQQLKAIVFHGADNAVPYFGSAWASAWEQACFATISLLATTRRGMQYTCATQGHRRSIWRHPLDTTGDIPILQ